MGNECSDLLVELVNCLNGKFQAIAHSKLPCESVTHKRLIAPYYEHPVVNQNGGHGWKQSEQMKNFCHY